MTKTLYIHAGPVKTGSSAIQSFFAENHAAILKEENLLYPVSYALTGNNLSHDKLFFQTFDTVTKRGKRVRCVKGGEDQQRREKWQLLGEEAAKHRDCDILVSREQVGIYPVYYSWDENWKRMILESLPGYDVKIIYYVRRLDDINKSWQNHMLKQLHTPAGTDSALKQFMNNKLPLAYSLKTIVDLWGRENCIFRIYDKSTLENGDVIKDFCSLIGFDAGKYGTEKFREVNQKVPYACLPYLEQLFALDVDRTSWTIKNLHAEVVDAFSEKAAAIDSAGNAWRDIDAIDALVPGYRKLFEKRPLSLTIPEMEVAPRDRLVSQNLFELRRASDNAAYCSLHNMLVQANPAAARKPLRLPTPWDKRGYLEVYRNQAGAYSLAQPEGTATAWNPVYGVAAQKAELHLLQAILLGIGLQDVGVCALEDIFQDLRDIDPNDVAQYRTAKRVCIPYEMQTLLTLPGQFLLGHISPLVLKKALGETKPLLIIRDLRRSVAAGAYFEELYAGKKPESITLTSAEILTFLRSARTMRYLSPFQENARTAELAHVARYEELMSRDRQRMAPSLLAIAAAVGCSEDEAYRGVLAAYESPLLPYARAAEDIHACWNQEVESQFRDLGLDAANARLGYESRYSDHI